MTELSLSVERTIAAPQDKLFNAWLDPEMLKRFMLPGEGMAVPRAASDAREGGRFEIIMQAGDQELPHSGTYKEIDPHNRIVFTWESPYSQDDSEVTLTFTQDGAGTKVRLDQVRFPSQESRDNHEGGWTKILEALETAAV